MKSLCLLPNDHVGILLEQGMLIINPSKEKTEIVKELTECSNINSNSGQTSFAVSQNKKFLLFISSGNLVVVSIENNYSLIDEDLQNVKEYGGAGIYFLNSDKMFVTDNANRGFTLFLFKH